MISRLLKLFTIAAVCLGGAGLHAGVVATRVYYDDSSGPNTGGNIEVPTFDYNDSLTDPETGVVFDFTVTLTAVGGNLRTNGGTNDREFGISTNNAAIDTVGESVVASVTDVTITDLAGNQASNVSVNFDGFTDLIVYFVDNDGDAGRVTDGVDSLFEWNGSLGVGSPDATGAPFTFGVSGEGATNTNVARVDVSSVLPDTLVAESKAFEGAGTPVDPNRWRVDDYGVQFTVDVVLPDPLTLRVSPNEMTLVGGGSETGSDLEIEYLEIRSETGSLDAAGYTGIGGDSGYPAGTGVGDGWEPGLANSANVIIESYLLGSSVVAVEQEVGLGDGFASGAQDLTFSYLESGRSDATVGLVEYVLPGDFNDDGSVDAADYALWRNNLGGDEAVLSGHGDGSGTVDAADYTIWRENFGSAWGAPASAAAAAVPEPQATFLALVGLAALAWLGRQRGVPRLAPCPSTTITRQKGANVLDRNLFPLVLAALGAALGASPDASAKPNIVFIMADDLGWSDTSNTLTNLNNPSDFYETPTLERLASEGMAFTNAYTNGPNCAPTRAAILTGQYAQRPTNNVYNVDNLNRGGSGTLLVGPPQGLPSGTDAIPYESFTYAEMMQTASYATSHYGKFHVVEAGTAAADIEAFMGFDENYGGNTNGGPGDYHANNGTFGGSISPSLDAYAADYTQQYVDDNIKPYANGTSLAEIDALVGTDKHVSDALADAAIDFMEREKDGSFLVQFNPYAVHTPIGDSQARSDLLAKYYAKTPGVEDTNESFGALIEGMDQSVARLIDYLEATDDPNNPGQTLDENTLVIFFSDNGGRLGQSNNGPLEGEKGELDEGGIRVPMIAWSGNPALVDGGTVNHTPVMGIDFYKTFANLSEAGDPAGLTLDGEDLTGILADSTADLGREDIFWHFPGYLIDGGRNQRPQSVIRSGDWKLMYNYEDQTYELYNLAADIGETSNVAGANPDITAEMALKLMLWLQETDAPLATLRSGSLNVTIDGAYYSDEGVEFTAGSISLSAGDEVPLVLGDLLSLADIDLNGSVDANDWLAFRQSQGTTFTELALLDAFGNGDLDGDGDNDVHDFILFKGAYDLENGAGSFAALANVPEPGAALLVLVAGLGVGARRRRDA